MILFLTYHKISVAGDRSCKDFYAVPRDVMNAQIKATSSAGYQPLPIRQLLTDDRFPSHLGMNYVLSYDDSTLDHYEIVFPMLQEAGLRAIFFVLTAKLNQPGYLTGSQVQELDRAGHCIGLHGHEHRRFDNMGDDLLRGQFERSSGMLGNLIGEAPCLFAPPGGFMNEHVREVALGFGVKTIRTMRWGFNHCPDWTGLETVPVNHHVTALAFQKILKGETPSRLLYLGKQAVKALVPAPTYERLRGLFFEFARKS
jgi:peptidoglycan/xylan/chitin deacetylase (PgdA/CDA1 family)